MQQKLHKQKKQDGAVKPSMPVSSYASTHRGKRQLRQTPRWVWMVGIGLFVLVAFFAWAWMNGRNSTLVEQLSEAEEALVVSEAEVASLGSANAELAGKQDDLLLSERSLAAEVVRLNRVLDNTVSTSQYDTVVRQRDGVQERLDEVRTELETVESEMAELRPLLAQARVELWQYEYETVPILRAQLASARGTAQTAQATLAAQRALIPGAVADVLHSAKTVVEAEHYVGVEWQIERRWFGSANDENPSFRNSHGEVEYRSLSAPKASYWDGDTVVASIGLPYVSDEPRFVISATDLQPNSGFLVDLANFLRRDTNLQPLLAEADRRLGEMACQDIESLQLFVDQVQATAEAAALEHDVRLRWRDNSGLYHTVVTDQLLLANAC